MLPIKNRRDLAQFLANRSATRPRNDVPTTVVEGSTATIRLYEPIDSWGGWWGLSAAELADALDALPSNVTAIRLLINSPGGDVFDGLAIMNMLSAHPAKVTAVVQGLAASAASFIAVGVDELVMNPGSMLMVHDASTVAYGWADDLRAVADVLDKVSDNIAGMYARKAGGEVDGWRATMKAETWYTAEEAVTAGLADRVQAATTEDAPADADPPEAEPDPFEDVLGLRTVAALIPTTEQLTAAMAALANISPAPAAGTSSTTPAGGADSASRDRDALVLLDL